ncbi:MAG: carbohydrate kinase [Mogibacterium sp.]|nr:carbohydrate kinase [Mogibacterium sp.]
MLDIMTLGEVLIDLTQTGTEKGIGQFAANPGGAPANVAVAAARLGARTGFIGKVGKDSFGQTLKETLAENGVDITGLYETAEAPTTLAIVSVGSDGERSFAFYRDPGADTLLCREEVIEALQQEALKPVFLHMGSLSLTAEPVREATFEAVRQAKKLGSFISYDPNYRANLWPDEATAVRWMRALLTAADVLKISDEELPLLTGTEDPAAGSLQLSEDGGIPLIVITLGGEGVFYRLGAETGIVPGCRVKVADTNGAGDTFFGALLSRLAVRAGGPLDGLTVSELEDYLRFANRAAALTCSRSGAIPAMPTIDELTVKE